MDRIPTSVTSCHVKDEIPKKRKHFSFDPAQCVRDNRPWRSGRLNELLSGSQLESRCIQSQSRIVAATVVRICSLYLSSSFSHSLHVNPASTTIRRGTRQQARVNAKPGCLLWRGARLISRAKPAGSKDIGTDCFRLCCSPAQSKRPTGTLVRFLIKPVL